MSGRHVRPFESIYAKVGHFSAMHPWWVVISWCLILLSLAVSNVFIGVPYSDDFTLPDSSSQKGVDLLDAGFPEQGGFPSPIVISADSPIDELSSTVSDGASRLTALPHVVSVLTPFDSPGAISSNGKTALLTVRFDENPSRLNTEELDRVRDSLASLRAAGAETEFGGTLGQAMRPRGNDALSETVGVVVAISALLIMFGSVLGAIIPIFVAAFGMLVGLNIVGLVNAATTFSTIAPTLAVMLGLGVGIDYSLFFTTRYRQLLREGLPPVDAALRTAALTGPPTVTAAGLVAAALLALYLSGVEFIGELGLAAAITVAVAPLSALTLLPAVLRLSGGRIDRWFVARPVAEPNTVGDRWGRYARSLGRHPVSYLIIGVLVLLALAAPTTAMRIGHIDAGAYPTTLTDRRAFDAIATQFGPGTNAPLTIVVDGPATTADRLIELEDQLKKTLATTPGVASVAPFQTAPDATLILTTVIPTTGPADPQTRDLLTRISHNVLPQALRSSSAEAYITGSVAAQTELQSALSRALPVVIGAVLLVTFLVLMVSLRSILLPAKAVLLNLLSIGAAYGMIVAVFQWGWGSQLLGLDEHVPIQSYVPIMMFVIVFGLSIDYEMFLLSRVREAWLQTGDNARAVVIGLSTTARVISAAAVTMTAVFFAFLLSSNVIVKMIALGFGVSILIDATVVRLVVVPAATYLFGPHNWWLPPRLRNILPAETRNRSAPAANLAHNRPPL